jgi:undecaprenyl-diphosphatase
MTPRRLLAVGLVASLAGFLALAWDDVAQGWLYREDFHIDAQVSAWSAAGWPVHPMGQLFSLPGVGLVDSAAVAVAALWMWRRGERRLAVACVAAGLAAAVLVGVLKPAFGRPLPPFIALRFPHGYGFPSGHTLGATATLGTVALLATETRIRTRRRAGKAARRAWQWGLSWGVAIAAVTGIARVLAQTHWVSDVLASWCLGTAVVCATLLAAGVPRPTPYSAP